MPGTKARSTLSRNSSRHDSQIYVTATGHLQDYANAVQSKQSKRNSD